MAVTPSRAWIAKRLRWSKVMSGLSPLPLLWLECRDSVLDLPMELPGWWWSVKSNRDRCRDHRACHQFSFLDMQKYLRFLWSVQISNWHGVPSRCYKFILIFKCMTAKIIFYFKLLLVCGSWLYNRTILAIPSSSKITLPMNLTDMLVGNSPMHLAGRCVMPGSSSNGQSSKTIPISSLCHYISRKTMTKWHVWVAESWEFGCLLTVTSWAWVPKGQVAQNGRTVLEAVSLE